MNPWIWRKGRAANGHLTSRIASRIVSVGLVALLLCFTLPSFAESGSSITSVPRRPAPGALTGDADIRSHARWRVSRLQMNPRGPPAVALPLTTKRRLLIDPVTMSLRMLVPIYGSTSLERAVFGELRLAGILTDWVAGAAVPAALVTGGVVAGARGHREVRTTLLWSALALYLGTRIGMLIVGNDHIAVANREVRRLLVF